MIRLNDVLTRYFEENGIEYYAVLDYGVCREINSSLMGRESFVPRSVIIFLIPYFAGYAENLSVYSASLDYHLIIKELTDGLIGRLEKTYPSSGLRGYGDHSPINEIDAALRAGLGILGDSGLLINEKYGSYVFVADVITDISPDELGAQEPIEIKRCDHCGACRRACPTGILRSEGSDCLSAITQRKGELNEEEIALMRKYNTVWGCDICQSSCPHNQAPRLTPIEFFYRERIPLLTSELLDSMGKAEFKKRAFAWRGRRTVKRNLDLLGY